MKLLIVDDERAFLMVLREFLTQSDLYIDTAETFEEAMTYIENGFYDCVISDIRLTGAFSDEGLQILQYVKHRTPGTKVIIITGYDDPALMYRALTLGADYFFEKPVSANVLLNAIMTTNKGCTGLNK